jgi:hypothetical protein
LAFAVQVIDLKIMIVLFDATGNFTYTYSSSPSISSLRKNTGQPKISAGLENYENLKIQMFLDFF